MAGPVRPLKSFGPWWYRVPADDGAWRAATVGTVMEAPSILLAIDYVLLVVG